VSAAVKSYTAPLACPACGHEFRGRWEGRKTAGQRCDACGQVFEAAWPGFRFEPETIIVRAGGERDDQR
jgi:hypothetical protein